MNHASLIGSRALRLAAVLCLCAAGCKTASFTPYVAPRVTGAVVQADTGAPLQGAIVSRATGDLTHGGLEQPKGGQMLEQPAMVTTDRHGEFTLKSVRSLSVFPRATWFSSGIVVERAGFERQVLTFSLTDATNTPAGEPLIEAGKITLVHARKKQSAP
jgi:hypothetical protein